MALLLSAISSIENGGRLVCVATSAIQGEGKRTGDPASGVKHVDGIQYVDCC